MVKLFFTGGTGFFGRAMLRHIMAQHAMNAHGLPDDVVVLTRSPERFLANHAEFSGLRWLRFHKGDIENAHSLPRGEEFTHVLHAAADSTGASQLSPLQRYDQIVSGTRNVLDLAVASGAKRFLLTSSGAVYGPQPAYLDGIPEDWHGGPDSLNPASAYGVAKRSAEHLCVLYGSAYGLQTVIARCFAFSGPDLPLDEHFAFGNFIRDALWRDEITVAGDGTPLRSFLDQYDLAHWLLTLIERGRAGCAYNVGSDQSICIADLACLIRDIVAPGKRVCIRSNPNPDNDRNLYVPRTEKARAELGLHVNVSLAGTIRNTADGAIRAKNGN